MSELLDQDDFTQHLVNQLKRFELDLKTPEPLLLELHYGEEEPVLAIPLAKVYADYSANPDQLDRFLEPYITEVGWTAQQPRYQARDIFEHTFPVMKDALLDPIPADGEAMLLDGEQVFLRLPKGPILYQELVRRTEENLVLQFMLEESDQRVDLHRGDVLNCFPEPVQISDIAIQNLAKRALQSGLTMRNFRVENFSTELLIVGSRNEQLVDYMASLVNISDVMLALERNLNTSEGILVIVPSQDQMVVTTQTSETAVAEMGILAAHLKEESGRPVSNLVWRFKEGDIVELQTVNLQEETNA